MAHSRESPLGRGRRRSVITNRLASMRVASRNSLSESSSLTSPISRKYSRTGSSESSAATSGFLRSSVSSSRSSFSCCTSMLISGSPTSSPINTRSFRALSSFRFPLEFFAPFSCQELFGSLARGMDGFPLVLRFSFCDDLFLTVMCPFLPDDITYELLRLDSELQLSATHHKGPVKAIVTALRTFSDMPGPNHAAAWYVLTPESGKKPRANHPLVGLPRSNSAAGSGFLPLPP